MDRRLRERKVRPHRLTSPQCLNDKRNKRLRDSGADEMIRFVREFQSETQPMRLQRRAPLPEIGQPSDTNNSCDYLDANLDSDDNSFEDEIASIESKSLNTRIEYRSNCRLLSNSTSRSYQHIPSRMHGRLKHDHVQPSYSRLTVGQRSQRNLLKQLPPIQKDSIPERPTAPLPSVTPPLPNEELDSAGEPVDFIDIA